ncbi:hypothetical protein, variant [Cladophialophora immunda]|nr:hypothetical protein, variant [Cladophialophora immunda]KIW22062.1 hypothetical protein, variant [Cladophialophora immunda]
MTLSGRTWEFNTVEHMARVLEETVKKTSESVNSYLDQIKEKYTERYLLVKDHHMRVFISRLKESLSSKGVAEE